MNEAKSPREDASKRTVAEQICPYPRQATERVAKHSQNVKYVNQYPLKYHGRQGCDPGLTLVALHNIKICNLPLSSKYFNMTNPRVKRFFHYR